MTGKDFDDLVRRMERRHAGRPVSLERATTAWKAPEALGGDELRAVRS